MQKEILTMEKIKNDLQLVKNIGVAEAVLYIVISAMLGIPAVLLLIGDSGKKIGIAHLLMSGFLMIFSLLLIGSCVYHLCLRWQYKKLAKSGKFLINKSALKDKTFWGPHRWKYNTTYVFRFSKYGSFVFSLLNGAIEDIYNGITMDGLYRLSEPGDLFYLVCNKRGKVLIAYPAKLFEFPEIDG